MMCMPVSDYHLQWFEMRYSAALRAVAVAVALALAGCAESPPPVTAERILDVGGIQPVVNAVALSPDGSFVAVGDMDGELVVRELPSGTERWRGRVAAGRVDGLVFSADGSLLASTAQDGRTFELWQVLAGRQAAVLEIRDSRTAAFHPTAENFHAFRTETKTLWYQVRILRPINPVVLKNLSEDLGSLGNLLGRAHDLNFLRERLRMDDGEPVWQREAQKLLTVIETSQSNLQRDATVLGQHVFAERPRDFGARLASWLNAWEGRASPSIAVTVVS